MSQLLDDILGSARDAIRRHAWHEAFDLLMKVDASGALAAQDLEALGEVCWWVARMDVGIDALERAYAAYLEAGDPVRAAHVALTLFREYNAKLAGAVAKGWLKRAMRLLTDQPEAPAHGYLEVRLAAAAVNSGKYDEAVRHAQRALEIGTRFGDRDLQAYGLLYEGMALVSSGQVEEGFALIDEATAAAVGGELGPYATGIVYCNTISICRDMGDFRRASDWTEAAKRWCERQAISGFPGVCRVHRAEVMALRGAWVEAEEEARRASAELLDYNRPSTAADAFYEIGGIRARMGDLAAAQEALAQANELGRSPEPALSVVRLAQGQVESAAAGIRQALADDPVDRFVRARLLPTQVEVAIAQGETATAHAAADELAAIAETYQTAALEAAAQSARGAVLLAEGDAQAAVAALRRAWRLWQDLEAPYEAAQARVLVGQAHRSLGDEPAAVLELRAALSAFERLGAVPDTRRVGDLLAPAAPAAGQQLTRTFMFTDIVRSTALVEAIGDEAWTDLVIWHDRTLRSLFPKHGGEEINHAGDGFFVAFEDANRAIDCAVAIQRTLAEHRKSHGFSPQVRIGLHTAEALMAEDVYRGRGVHEAARIGALAEGGEILSSRKTFDEAGCDLTVSEARTVTLRGVSEPVEVVAIDWR